MTIRRTAKADEELRPGTRTLGLRERSILLLANGRRTTAELVMLLDPASKALLSKLIGSGYLIAPEAGLHTAAQTIVANAVSFAAPAVAAPPADTFECKRSLAATRMYLFDLCERMFTRREPQQAERFREALRTATDRGTLLAAARDMLQLIDQVAGAERAESIHQRIAMLLPPELVETS